MMAIIGVGEPFNCLYVKKNGELSEFVNIRKFKKEPEPNVTLSEVEVGVEGRTERKRSSTQFDSLIPFMMQNSSLRELYTRCIVKFNNEEVVL